MKEKEKENKGYIMIYAKELSMMNKVMEPEQVQRILYNIANFAIEAHGGEAPEDIPMTDIEYIAYKTMKERIKGNLENAAKRKPGGAPIGNQNAASKDEVERYTKVQLLRNMGLNAAQISRESGIPDSTVRRIIEDLEKIESEYEEEKSPNKHKKSPNKHKTSPDKQSGPPHNHNYNNNWSCLAADSGEARQNTTARTGDHPATEPSVASDCETPPTAAASQKDFSAVWDKLDEALY